MTKKIHNYKIVLLGETSVGKSSIVTRFVRQEFYEDQEPTIGAAFQTQKLEFDDFFVNMEMWDTAGQERYKSLAPMYYRGAKAAIVVYDITSKESLHNAKVWIKELKMRGEKDVIISLLGNKLDIDEKRVVEKEEVMELAEQNDLIFFEVSAKTGENVGDALKSLSKKLVEISPNEERAFEEFKIQKIKTESESCC